MTVFTRVKNNIEYAKYRRLKGKALVEVTKHQSDLDDTEFKYWMSVFVYATKKCEDIPLH